MEEIIDRAIAPDIHNMGRLSFPEAETMTLPNGLTLHFLSGGNADVSRIKILLPGGIAESPRPKLLEIANSLLLEGTVNHSGEQLSDIIEHNGAWTGIHPPLSLKRILPQQHIPYSTPIGQRDSAVTGIRP